MTNFPNTKTREVLTMSANTETTGAPEGYRKCSKKACSRWTYAPGACWTCCTPKGPDSVITAAMVASDWTPPIAAPVANVERRKGQRYKGVSMTWELKDLRTNEPYKGEWDAYSSSGSHGVLSESALKTMTLLADATPEPAKPCVCPHGPHATDGKCPIHVTAGMESSGFQGCACAKCVPPAQEAPKTAPVCCDPFGNSVHHVEVLKRTWKTVHTGGAWTLRTDWLCSLCLSENEPSGGGSDVLHNDDTPERLPRPQLAADWVEDCLPESGR